MAASRTNSGVGRHRGSALLAAVALVGAVGCGGQDDHGTAAPSVATAPSATTDDPTDGTNPTDGTGAADEPAADTGEVAMAELEARDAWVRMPAPGQSLAAAYLTFVNRGDTDVHVADVSSPLAVAELHETVVDDDGVMRMEHRAEGFVVPAGGELVLEPGGAHVMLLDVDRLDLRLLEETDLRFQIDGGELVVIAEIRGDASDPAPTDPDEASEGATHHDPAFGLDADALHALDDELHAGIHEPERQRGIIADALAALEHVEASADAIDDVRTVLVALDVALRDGDVAAAADLAFQAHDRSHALAAHDHASDGGDHEHDH